MIGYFVVILLAAGSVLAAVLFFRHRQKQVMDGLSDMLEEIGRASCRERV